MKKYLIFICVFFVSCASDIDNEYGDTTGEVASAFQGTGTQDNPYIISKASELRKLSVDVNSGEDYRGKFFKMTSNIIFNVKVLTSDGSLNNGSKKREIWTPIGVDFNHPFSGTFDGNGYKISGLYCKREVSYAGLFGWACGTIKNLTIDDSYFEATDYAACFVAAAGDYTNNVLRVCLIENCINGGSVNSPKHAAAFVAKFNYGTIDKCVNYGLVKGGIVGGFYASGGDKNFPGGKISDVANCMNYGQVIGNIAGGIGGSSGDARIYNSINYGNIISNDMGNNNYHIYAAGIIGATYWSTELVNCINYGSVYAPDNAYGGIGGWCDYQNRDIGEILVYYIDNSPRAFYKADKLEAHATAVTYDDIKDPQFLTLLNKNVSIYGSSWCQWIWSEEGLPQLDYEVKGNNESEDDTDVDNEDKEGDSSYETPYVTSFSYNATQTSITVQFNVNVRPTSATVKYGTGTPSSSVSSSISGKKVIAKVQGLKKGTKYYFRCTVSNTNGSSTSDVYSAMTFY